MKAAWRSDIGRLRQSNQDACLVLEGEYPLFAVADGMGGHRGGDIASAMAISMLREQLGGHKPAPERIRRCYTAISRQIFERQRTDTALAGMGTTLTMLWADRERILLGHVGDSRIYLLRDGLFKQLSMDHSLVGELLRAGTLDERGARSYPYRNVITRALGTQASVRCDTMEAERRPGDRWLLCSDGLTEQLDDLAIKKLLMLPDLEQAAGALLNAALDDGGRDNISLVVLEVPAW